MPIIASKVGALPEFFEHEKSIIFIEPGNIPQLKSAVEDLVSDKRKRERLGKAAAEVFVEKLSRTKIINQLDDFYRRILHERLNYSLQTSTGKPGFVVKE